MLKAFLFDMDGVLFDSMKNHAEAWYQTMGEHYGFTCDRTLFYLYEGSTGAQTIDALFTEQRGRHATPDEIERIYGEKAQCFVQLGPADPMPGADEVIRSVMERGLKRVLVTGSSQTTLINRLQRTYPDAFDGNHIVWGRDCPIGHGKPHPDPYLMGLEKAGNLQPDEAIVVENAPMGVQAGKAAGIFTVAVNTGPLEPKILKDSGADIVLSSMQELADRLDEIIGLQQNRSK
ncbi:MAG: HAD-IA family hydrolase [Bacteroidales bacterium]|nr:HAD-IA family hydrolase [Bacteroidales bacterium]